MAKNVQTPDIIKLLHCKEKLGWDKAKSCND